MARTLADQVGSSAQRDLQLAATQGRNYTVALYSASRVPAKLRREFSAKVKALDGVVEVVDDENATEGIRRWTVVAKGNFSEKIDDLIDEIVEAESSIYKAARFEKHGNRMVFCVEGKCPTEI
jgi:L-lysine 2,3-aminomutase